MSERNSAGSPTSDHARAGALTPNCHFALVTAKVLDVHVDSLQAVDHVNQAEVGV
jgi:hypothetical protein